MKNSNSGQSVGFRRRSAKTRLSGQLTVAVLRRMERIVRVRHVKTKCRGILPYFVPVLALQSLRELQAVFPICQGRLPSRPMRPEP